MWFIGDIGIGALLLAIFFLGGKDVRSVMLVLFLLLCAIVSGTARYWVLIAAAAVLYIILVQRYSEDRTLKHFREKYGDLPDGSPYWKLYPEEWKDYNVRMQWKIVGPSMVVLLIVFVVALLIITI